MSVCVCVCVCVSVYEDVPALTANSLLRVSTMLAYAGVCRRMLTLSVAGVNARKRMLT
jgi:hypothetical protein